MKFTERSSILLIICAAIALVGAIFLNFQRQYNGQIEHITTVLQAKVADNLTLQLATYEIDKPQLKKFLDTVVSLPTVSGAEIIDRNEVTIGLRGDILSAPAGIRGLRGESAVTAVNLIYLSPEGETVAINSLTQLLGNNTAHLTIPISTSLDLKQREYTATDFLQSSYANVSEGSQWVTAYLHVALNQKTLQSAALPALLYLLLFYLIFLVLGGIALYLHTQKIKAPVRELRRLSENLSQGKPLNELDIEEDSELGSIAIMLNSLISSAKRLKSEAELDRKMLSRKVDESTSKLSAQDDQLNRAAQEISQARDRLQKIVNYDPLTTLPNRTLFQDVLRSVTRSDARNNKPLALLSLNLNNFRRVNANFGPSSGDLVIREIGKRLAAVVRDCNVVSSAVTESMEAGVARLEGDGFGVILDDLTSKADAEQVARDILAAIVAPIHIDGQEIRISPSIGIAYTSEKQPEMEPMIRQAGIAMSNAPTTAEGAYLIYEEGMGDDDAERVQLENDLRSAVENEQLTLHYQPQIDSIDGSVISTEVLLRWTHPELGNIPPARFIPLARKIGAMNDITGWIMREACRQLQEFRRSGVELSRIAINVSAEELGKSLVDHVKLALVNANLKADSIELGLSEIVLMDESSEEVRCLRELSDLGVHLSLDNFGISATPLSHLNHYPLNALRIDRDIVHNCDSNKRNASLVRTIIAIANSLGLRAVAEGVETEAEFSFLLDAGARAVQGYLFSEPAPAERLQQELQVPWPYMGIIQNIKLASRPEQH